MLMFFILLIKVVGGLFLARWSMKVANFAFEKNAWYLVKVVQNMWRGKMWVFGSLSEHVTLYAHAHWVHISRPPSTHATLIKLIYKAPSMHIQDSFSTHATLIYEVCALCEPLYVYAHIEPILSVDINAWAHTWLFP